jgi:hypothetical protein
MVMSRDAGQTTPSRCFADCEREQFQQRIAELEAKLEAVEILVKAVGEGHTHIRVPPKPYKGNALDVDEGSEILTLQAYAKTLEVE